MPMSSRDMRERRRNRRVVNGSDDDLHSVACLTWRLLRFQPRSSLRRCSKRLHLPKQTYKTHVAAEGKLQASVMFFPTAHYLSLTYGTIQLGGGPMDSVEDANNDASKQAINYMEKNERKILKDYNYEELDKKNKVKDRHGDELTANNRKYMKIIQEKDQNIKDFTRYLDDCVMNASNINDKVDHITEGAYTAGTS